MSTGSSPAEPANVGGIRGWEVPSSGPVFVGRRALLDRLDGAVRRRLTFVSGPAGTGKTALVAAWCRQGSPHPVAWVRVEPDDSADAICARAISAIGASTGGVPAAATVDPGGRLGAAAIDRLAGDLEGTAPCVVVIDGPGRAHVGPALDIAAAAERSPQSGLRLIVISRSLPPDEVVALQLRGVADHLSADDLAVDAGDLAQIVEAHASVRLDAGAAAELATRLEGWMVGAVIVGMTHPRTSEATVDQLMAGAIENLDAYVNFEILRGLAEDHRRFLFLTASLGALDPDLVIAVTGRQDAAARLDDLRTVGLPICRRPSRGGVLEYIRPFREVVEARAQRHDPRAHAEALRSAARWFARHRRPLEAADTWARLGEWDEAIAVIAMHVPLIVDADEVGRLADVVTRVPPAVMHEHLHMALQGAWVLRMAGRISAAYEMLAVYEPAMAPAGRAVADVIRSSVASWVDDTPGVLGFAESALAQADLLGPDAYDDIKVALPLAATATTAVYRTIAHGNALLACAFGGLWWRGEPHLEALQVDTTGMLLHTQRVQLHGCRAVYLALSGRPNAAAFEAHEGLAIASEAGTAGHDEAAEAQYALGESQRLIFRHDEALDTLAEAMRAADAAKRRNLVTAIVGSRALALVDAGRHHEALEVVRLHRPASSHVGSPTIAAMLAVAEARALAAGGAYRRGLRALDGAPPTATVASACVSIAVTCGELARARAAVESWPNEPTVDAGVRRAIAAAVVDEAGGDRRRQGSALTTALELAAEHGLLQPFMEFGPIMLRTLQRAERPGEDSPAVDFVHEVEALLSSGTAGSVAPRFTARESAILGYLTQGMALAEVGEQVNLSVNTIKTHVKAIYRKLGVGSRADAVRMWSSITSSHPE